MADTKVFSNGNIDVWVVPKVAIADIEAIDASVINESGINISSAISWSDTTLPHATESDDVDDRSIKDAGNATSRGANNYEANLTLFYPKDITDPNSIYKVAWDLFHQTRVQYILVTRVLQGVKGELADAEPGQWYSAFDLMNSTYRNNTEGDDSVKYTVNFMPQGAVRVNGLFAGAGAGPVVTPASLSLSVGGFGVVKATAHGHRVTSIVDWGTENATVATVTPNGVVKGVGSGTTNIYFTDGSTKRSSFCAVTVA